LEKIGSTVRTGGQTNGLTDGRTDGVQHLMQPLGSAAMGQMVAATCSPLPRAVIKDYIHSCYATFMFT